MEVLINRSPGARRGRGRRARPLPHAPSAGLWMDLGLPCGLPHAAGAAAHHGRREPNLCPLEEHCLAVPSPCVLTRDPPWRRCCPPSPSCRRRGLESPVPCTSGPSPGLPLSRVGEIGRANTFLEKTECSQRSSA